MSSSRRPIVLAGALPATIPAVAYAQEHAEERPPFPFADFLPSGYGALERTVDLDDDGERDQVASECPAPPPPGSVERGRETYREKGPFADCHGRDRTGAGAGPDLTDVNRIHGGEYERIVGIVRTGAPGAPPGGDADHIPEKGCAVAAYVHAPRP